MNNNNIAESRFSNNKTDGLQNICENCDSGDTAVLQCRVCCIQMCEFCIEVHRRIRSTKKHSLTSLENTKSTKISKTNKPSFCEKHKEETLNYFCQSPLCYHVVCQKCVLTEHKGHNYDFACNIFETKKKALRRLLDDVKSKMKNVQMIVSTLEEVENETSETVKSVNKDIDTYIDGILQMLEQKRNSLKEELEIISDRKNKQLKMEKEKFCQALKKMQSSVDLTEEALNRNSDFDFLLVENDLTQRIRQLELENVSRPPNKTSEIVLETTRSKIAELINSLAQVSDSEQCNMEEVMGPMSLKSNNISKEKENHTFVKNDNDYTSYFYDDVFDYYKLVKVEVEKTCTASNNIVDSSTYASLCKAGYCKDGEKILSHSFNVPKQDEEKIPPPSPLRTCAPMCEVYRLPSSCYSETPQLKPQKRKFELQAKTKDGLLQRVCGDQVCVTIENPHDEKEVLHVVDNGDGLYTFDFTPRNCGKYTIYITVNGQSVKKQGFSYEVPNCSKIISDRGL